MTKAEFLSGWALLVLQPWGWRFNQTGKDGKPTGDALAQLEFYFEALRWAHPEAWRKVAAQFAEGSAWPSVADLRHALKQTNQRFVKPIADRSTTEFCECPPEVAAILDRIRQGKNFSFPADRQGKA
jgi:hypothetical protein